MLSLIFWSLLVLVSLKYVVLLLRADNAGEGGILSLVALIQQKTGQAGTWSRRAVAIGVMGTALFFCDALITPAISVLSAVEGMELLGPKTAPVRAADDHRHHHRAVRHPAPWHRARWGCMFGPIMLVWFLAIGLLGVRCIVMRAAGADGRESGLRPDAASARIRCWR